MNMLKSESIDIVHLMGRIVWPSLRRSSRINSLFNRWCFTVGSSDHLTSPSFRCQNYSSLEHTYLLGDKECLLRLSRIGRKVMQNACITPFTHRVNFIDFCLFFK